MPPANAANPAEIYSDSLWEEFAETDVADVVVDVDAPDLLPTYAYRVPDVMQNTLQVGMCVHVPFGGRETLGYVLSRRKISAQDPLCGKLKPLIAVVEDAITINQEQIDTVQWMSDRYICHLIDAIRCVAPAILGAKVIATVKLQRRLAARASRRRFHAAGAHSGNFAHARRRSGIGHAERPRQPAEFQRRVFRPDKKRPADRNAQSQPR